MIEVLRPGLLTSLQDGGRTGYGHLGIGRSGAADRPAMRLANALVGNPPDACVLEATLQGPRLRLHRDTLVALTGAPLPKARRDGACLPAWRPMVCSAGSILDLGAMPAGCRSYLAFAGGIDAKAWLGSRSTDLNAAVGPMQGRALETGDTLRLGTPGLQRRTDVDWSLDPRPWFPDPDADCVLRLLPGSHTRALEATSYEALTRMRFRVGADSNRVGVRLEGEAGLKLEQALEMVSEGTVAGVMQLPPGGRPIVLLNEHPVTGGYPRIAQLAAVDLPRLAQCRPGDTLHFTWTTPEQACTMLEERDRGLERLLDDIARRLEPDT